MHDNCNTSGASNHHRNCDDTERTRYVFPRSRKLACASSSPNGS